MSILSKEIVKTATDSFIDNNADYACKVIEMEIDMARLDEENQYVRAEFNL